MRTTLAVINLVPETLCRSGIWRGISEFNPSLSVIYYITNGYKTVKDRAPDDFIGYLQYE